MPVADVNGTRLWYDVVGENGTPMVFVPGLGCTHTMYHPQVAEFRGTNRVITMDLRGNGESGGLDAPIDGVLALQCRDIAALLDLLNIEKAVFVGVSYGGVILQQFVHMFPERVKGLVITDSFCDTKVTSVGLGTLIAVNLTFTYYIAPEKLGQMTEKAYLKWPLAAQEMKKAMIEMRKKETVLQRKAINRIRFLPYLPEITAPTLAVVGENMALLMKTMKQISSGIPGARLVVLPDSQDPSNLCQPDRYNGILRAFLTEKNL